MINFLANNEHQVHQSSDLCITFEEFDRERAQAAISLLINKGYKVLYTLEDEDCEKTVYLRRSN